MDIYDNGMYTELCDLAHELEPWFSIDKVKSYSVCVWTKASDDSDPFDHENVFDIFEDYLQFYTCSQPWVLPNEAIPVIEKIQKKLREIEEFYTKKE